MKTFHIALTLLLTAAALSHAEKPNIVFFLIDDLGSADCGFTGGKDIKTPNIDRLASEGARLESFYVQPVCSPTRAALMTGRYATRTGVYTVVRPGAKWGLPLAERTLPQALREAGYTTAICGKWHLGEFEPAYMPTARGFDRQYGHMFGMIDYFTHVRSGKRDWYRDDKPLIEQGYTTQLIATEATRIIREQPPGKPLFLYVPFNGIHTPHQVPAKYKEPYSTLPEPRRSIAGMLAAVDEGIGQISAALEEKGLAKNTILLFSADNGGPSPGRATDNGPLRAGKGTIYEGGVRAAAFAKWPGKIPAGTTIKEPLHIVDCYPTLLKLAGAPLEQKLPLDGLDITPVLTTGAKTPHDAILIVGGRPTLRAIRAGDWKFIINAGASDDDGGERKKTSADKNEPELYNLAADPGEKHNLAPTHPEKSTELQARLNTLMKDAVPPGNP